MIEDGCIVIENCSHSWQFVGEKQEDVMVLHLLFKLFRQYQEEGSMPEYVTYDV